MVGQKFYARSVCIKPAAGIPGVPAGLTEA